MKSNDRPTDAAFGRRLNEFVRYAELKQLAYKIAALQQERRFHSLAVLSFLAGEGKTLLCAALAAAYAETCRTRTLVVDSTTLHHPGSLTLKECMDGSNAVVQVLTLDDIRKNSTTFAAPPPSRETPPAKGPVLEPDEVVHKDAVNLATPQGNDLALLKRVAEDPSRQFGLIVLDTTPLSVKNKNNVDPLLLGHLADASLLVVSRKFLNAPTLKADLKVIDDPGLHLIGVVSNEAFRS